MFKNNYKLIIGLGNPEEKHKKNRHNAGFVVIDSLRKILDLPDFTFNKKFDCDISEQKNISFAQKIGLKDKEKIILVKPQTFMNKSGESVLKIINFYKIKPENIIVIHDDLDILIGNHKISKGSGPGGHNGVDDIINKLGTKNFLRVKIGVEQEEGRKSRKIPGKKFVLQDFSPRELKKIKEISALVSKTLFEK